MLNDKVVFLTTLDKTQRNIAVPCAVLIVMRYSIFYANQVVMLCPVDPLSVKFYFCKYSGDRWPHVGQPCPTVFTPPLFFHNKRRRGRNVDLLNLWCAK